MKTSSLLALAAALPITLAQAQDGERSLNPLAGFDKSSLKGFVEQPLFDPSRRPPIVVAPVTFVPPPPPPIVETPPPLHVIGVVEGAHSLAAVVHRDDTGKTETLHAGDHIGSWSIAVLPSGLRVQNGDRTFDYALFNGPRAGPVAVVLPPPTPAVAGRGSSPSQ